MKTTIKLPEAYGLIDGLRSLQCTSFKLIDVKYKNLKALEDAINNQVRINKEIIANGGAAPNLNDQAIEVEIAQLDKSIIDALGEFKCNDNGYFAITQHITIEPESKEEK